MPAKAGISGRKCANARMRGGWVYIMSNKPHGTLYIGVTADLAARVGQHRERKGGAFARRYNCDRVIYAEPHDRIEEAIAREKAIKAWPRLWKLRLIQEQNPSGAIFSSYSTTRSRQS